MFQDVTLPLWLLILIVGFAAVTFASHFLFPSVRWFFRKRAERALAQLNTRLDRPIELWWGIQPISAGVFGVPVGFAVIILVSLITPAPSRKIQELVEHVRYPSLRAS